jgi:methylated-DNA-[protein]-cysteine S-methyltransferase
VQKIFTRNYKSPYGELVLGSLEDKLCLCDWRYRKMRDRVDARLRSLLSAEFVPDNSPVIEQTIKQLKDYYQGRRRGFDVPLLLAGTDFQQQVWRALIDIPYGEITSYRELSEAIGNKSAVRAVANANGANAISILIPCHRVVGSNGELTGYGGGLRAKAKLLELEQSLLNTPKTPMQTSLSLS